MTLPVPHYKALKFFFVGGKGVLKTQSGLHIAYLSGVDKSDAPEVCYNYFAVHVDTSNILGVYISSYKAVQRKIILTLLM